MVAEARPLPYYTACTLDRNHLSYIPPDTRRPFTCRLPIPLLLWLDQQARADHTSRSQILQRLILQAMRSSDAA